MQRILIVKERQIIFLQDEKKLTELSLLDGCYAIKSNVPKDIANAENLHERYKSLAQVEQAFRTMKQSFLEVRPIFVRKDSRTRGHVFVCMLAYYVVKYITDTCKELGFTKEYIFQCLDSIQYTNYAIKKDINIKVLPKHLLPNTKKIIEQLNISLPDYL